MFRILLIGLLSILPFLSYSQKTILHDPEIIHLIHQSYDSIYNLNFESADASLKQLEQKTPGHPVYPILRAMYYYWKNMPIDRSHPEYNAFYENLNLTAERADKMLEENEDSPEGIFFGMSAHAMLAMQYSEEKSYIKAVKSAKTAYSYMKKGFGREEEFPEFYFSSGLYNFYREQYPESYPTYRSFTWLFAEGDKELGVEQMRIAAKRSVFIRTEASTYVAHINLRYLDNPQESAQIMEKVATKFPRNQVFKTLYTEALLATGEYEEARPLAEELTSQDDLFIKMAGEYFQGMIYEKEDANLFRAEKFYKQSLQTASEMPENTWNYNAFVYAGLARIADLQGNRKQAETYYKKVLKIARYNLVKDEAKAYLYD